MHLRLGERHEAALAGQRRSRVEARKASGERTAQRQTRSIKNKGYLFILLISNLPQRRPFKQKSNLFVNIFRSIHSFFFGLICSLEHLFGILLLPAGGACTREENGVTTPWLQRSKSTNILKNPNPIRATHTYVGPNRTTTYPKI